jgi:hypothetical protein
MVQKHVEAIKTAYYVASSPLPSLFLLGILLLECLYTLVGIILCVHTHTYRYRLSGASLITIHYSIVDEAGNGVIR